jgi:outer membrane protein TolC
LFDEQRFALKESKLLADKSKVEKQLIVRNIITQSLDAYVDWSTAYSELEIVTAYLDRVSERHNFVIQLFKNGDKPAIDTIESRINLNTANKAKITATENLIIKSQKLNMFLWDNSGNPMVILESVIPQYIVSINEILNAETIPINQNWIADPIIRKKQIEMEQINLENRLEREQLKPQLDIKLNTIHSLGDTDLTYSYNVNDYKLGATVAVPIRNRKTRGQIQLNEVLIEQNKLDQEYYQIELQNMYSMLVRTKALNQESLNVSIEKVKNSNALYTAEQLKFELGESSVFLLNSRERKLLEAETEYLKNLKALSLIYNELYFLKLGQEIN